MLFGKYYHDAALTVSITDIMFGLDYVGFITGTNPSQGGIALKEEQVTIVGGGGSANLSEKAVAFSGSMIGWYKKVTDTVWSIGNINEKTMTIPGAKTNDVYCVKYFWYNINARSITISAQYVPKTIHLVLINDLFPGDEVTATVSSTSPKAGRLITDIPRFNFDGSGDLTLSSASAATMPLTGTALAVSSSDTCEEAPYYATMVEELYDTKWQNNVRYLAVEGGDVDLASDETETLIIRAIFADGTSMRMPNSEFTFAVETAPVATATGVSVGANDGVIKAGSQAGTAVISVNLTDYTDKVEPAYVLVTVT